MISLKKIELINFISYKHQIIDFEKIFENENVFLIHGKNLDNSNFENDNGVGKSLIYEAILFSLFGRTARGSTINGLIGPHAKWMCVKQILKKDNDVFTIKRYRKHPKHKNKLIFKINGTTIKKSTVTDIQRYMLNTLNISYRRVINTSIFSSQDERKRFAYLSDRSAKELIMQMKGYDILLLCQELALMKEKELSRLLSKLNIKFDNLRWKIRETKKNKRILKSFLEDTKKDSEIILLSLKKEIDDLENEKSKCNKAISSLRKENYALKIEKRKLQKRISKLNSKLNNVRSDILSLKSEISSIDGEILAKLKPIEVFSEIKKKKIKCQSCGRTIKRDKLKKHIRHVNSEIKKLKKQKKQVEIKIAEIGDKEGIFLNKINKRDIKLHSIITKLIRNSENIKNYESKIESIECEIDKKIRKTNKTKQDKKYKSQKKKFEKVKNEIKKYKQKRKDIKNKINKLSKLHKVYTAWSIGFSKEEIQNYALIPTIKLLNERMEYFSDKLTEGSINVKLLTKNKKKNSFKLEIKDNTGKKLSFKEWSTGQKKRIEIVISFALMRLERNLISEIFLDELFDGLDKIGRMKVVNMLIEESSPDMRFIIISHSDDIKNMFTNKGTVTLKSGISKFKIG